MYLTFLFSTLSNLDSSATTVPCAVPSVIVPPTVNKPDSSGSVSSLRLPVGVRICFALLASDTEWIVTFLKSSSSS